MITTLGTGNDLTRRLSTTKADRVDKMQDSKVAK
jgi:hypothetical protein